MEKNGNVVGVSMGITQNLGNFNSLRLDAWASEEVPEGASREEIYDRLWEQVNSELEEKIEESKAALES